MSDLVTLVMGGKPTLTLFAEGVRHFGELVHALTAEESRATGVVWELDGLQYSSAVITVRGVGPAKPVSTIVQTYQRVGQELATGQEPSVKGRALNAVHGLLGVLNGKIDHLRFETAEGESIVRHLETSEVVPTAAFPVTAFGTVEGHVQSMSNRRSLRFTLYDVVWDQAVSCYLTPENEGMLADVWDRLVVVEGKVNRDPLTGRPTSVREITDVRPIERGDPDAYRQARGAVPAPIGAEPAEDLLRRIWDERQESGTDRGMGRGRLALLRGWGADPIARARRDPGRGNEGKA